MRHVWGYRVWTSPQISPFYFSIHSYDSYDSWCRLGAFLLRFSRESIWVITGPMFCWRFGSNVNVRGSLWSTLAHERQTPGQDGNRELNEAVDGPAKVGRVMLGLSLLALLKFLCFSTGMFGSTWLGQHGAAYKNIASLLHIQYVDMYTYIHIIVVPYLHTVTYRSLSSSACFATACTTTRSYKSKSSIWSFFQFSRLRMQTWQVISVNPQNDHQENQLYAQARKNWELLKQACHATGPCQNVQRFCQKRPHPTQNL